MTPPLVRCAGELWDAEKACVSETKNLHDKEKAEKIRKDVMGEEWISAYPDGIETRIGRAFGGVDLSGGEKNEELKGTGKRWQSRHIY